MHARSLELSGHLFQYSDAGSETGKTVYPVSAINVLKAHGKSSRESALLPGYALNMARASQGMPKRVGPAKIACVDFNLQKARMQMGIQVLLKSSSWDFGSTTQVLT